MRARRRRWPRPDIEHGLVWPHRGPGAPWLWFTLPGFHYDGLVDAERFVEHQRLCQLIAALGLGEGHLIAVDQPFDPDGWDPGLATPGEHADEWTRRTATAREWLAGFGFRGRRVYLGVRLTLPAAVASRALFRAARLGPWGDRSETTRNGWRDIANRVAETVAATGIPAVPAPADELRQLVTRPLWVDPRHATLDPTRAMVKEIPYKVEIHRPGGAGETHVASLVVTDTRLSEFPGGEWLMPIPACETEGWQPDVSVRFDLIGSSEQATIWERTYDIAWDQAENMGDPEGGASTRVSMTVADQLAVARQMAADTPRDPRPWVWPVVTFTIAADTDEQLWHRVTVLTSALARVGLTVTHPGDLQWPLLADQIPGARWRVRGDLQRRIQLETFAAGMPHATVRVGMDRGPYVGHTCWGTVAPVLFDPLALAPANLPPTVSITGKPGSGKSVLAKLLVAQMRWRGAWGLWLDPMSESADVLDLPGLGRTQVIELDGSFGALLDPWTFIADTDDAALLAVDIARMVLPPTGGDIEIGLTIAADQTSRAPEPSMALFLDRLCSSEIPAMRSAGEALRAYSGMNLARLFFQPGPRRQLDVAGALTVLRWRGLDLPAASTPSSEHTVKNRLSLAVLMASAALATGLTDHGDRHQPKFVVQDENHLFTGSAAGRAMTGRNSLLARKLNTAQVLITQNAAALGAEEVRNNVSAAFAFAAPDLAEQAHVAHLLRRDASVTARLADLPSGRCLFRDHLGRVAQIEIDVLGADLLDAVQTTPLGAIQVGG